MSYNLILKSRRTFRSEPETAALAIAGASLLALAAVWGLELLGGYAPCELCLQERIPYYFAVPAGLAAAILARQSPRAAGALLVAVCAALLFDAGLGIYHAGVEWHFWPGPDSCAATETLAPMAPGDLMASLQNHRLIRCDEAAFRILGISLAGYNVLFAAALSAFGFWTALRSTFWRDRTPRTA